MAKRFEKLGIGIILWEEVLKIIVETKVAYENKTECCKNSNGGEHYFRSTIVLFFLQIHVLLTSFAKVSLAIEKIIPKTLRLKKENKEHH